MNLWLFKGRPPTDAQPVEIVIRSFSFTPPWCPVPQITVIATGRDG
jgi:hypothetical protein